MKLFNYLLVMLIICTNISIAQDSANPGEDFDLEALPGILEKVSTFEELEKAINDSANNINNLDLDNNGEVDYVLIQEEAEGETHIAIFRVATGEDEFQDIATIEMEKQSDATATFQIVGDVDLYGEDYILEPEGGVVDISESGAPADKGSGPSYYIPPPPAVRVTICVGVFRPGYRIWISPWGFRMHPVWFRPWRPFPVASFMAMSMRWHRKSFMRTKHRRSMRAHNMQKKNKRSSPSVNKKGSPGKSGPSASPSKGKPKSTPAKTQPKKGQPTKKKPHTTKKR